ncbi:hypothetical protein [Cohnella sp. JJ-181]|uniref:hypothetical protein n=1 Tax=Cohnella rhizoplanae TaxID=2974897 RepID=UPI0022FF6C2F|nr:hypothetical protein [Cohnella sp. JJ-181]CAI6082704.1 hypothetical protein COHCIP112018_03730 [Cohnella sp. JJ-181]
MNEISLFRLYLLRAGYLFIAVGLGVFMWPDFIRQMIHPDPQRELMDGVVACMQAALSLLALLGLRYPLRMLPVLLWEMLWKSIWLLIVALPAWSSGQMTDPISETVFSCALGAVVAATVPWPYIYAQIVRKPGDRWGKATKMSAAAAGK